MLKTNKNLGFTLMELITVMAIIIILTSIAIPSYTTYVMKSNRSQAMQIMTSIVAQAEIYYNQNNNIYPSSLAMAYGTATAPSSTYYTITGTNSCTQDTSSNCFEVTAIAVSTGMQNKDTGCTTLKLDTIGSRSPTTCWTP
jgi:type IV pilus assembly protein PilE